MARVISTTTTTGKKVLFVDVMLHDRFIFTLRYKYCPLFKLDLQDVYSKVIEKASLSEREADRNMVRMIW